MITSVPVLEKHNGGNMTPAKSVSESNPYHVLLVGSGNIRSAHATEEERDATIKTANESAKAQGLSVRYEAGTYSA